MLIGRAADTFAADPAVDGLSEMPVLHQTGRFAGVVLQALTLPRRLDTAVVHLKNDRIGPFIDDRLEWTGTGLELFTGYLLAVVLFVVPFGIINLVLQGVQRA